MSEERWRRDDFHGARQSFPDSPPREKHQMKYSRNGGSKTEAADKEQLSQHERRETVVCCRDSSVIINGPSEEPFCYR